MVGLLSVSTADIAVSSICLSESSADCEFLSFAEVILAHGRARLRGVPPSSNEQQEATALMALLRLRSSSSSVEPGNDMVVSIKHFYIVGILSDSSKLTFTSSLNLQPESQSSTLLTGCSTSHLACTCFRSADLCRCLSLTISRLRA